MSLEGLHLLPPEQQEEILNRPAHELPDGVRPNFDNPPDENNLVFAVVGVCFAVSAIAIVFHAHAKIAVIRKWYIEDALVYIGFGVTVGFYYGMIRLAHSTGFFVHQWNIRIRGMSELLYMINMISSFYVVTMGCVKVAILLEWNRIFCPNTRRGWFWYASWTLIIINAAFYVAGLIAGNLSCIPHEKIWDQTLEGHCINRKALDVANAAINVVSTAFILVLPQNIIWTLHMSLKKKIGVSSMFALGIFAVVSSCVRLAATVDYYRSDDVSYYVSPMALWCMAEQTCAIVVFCAPNIPRSLRESPAARFLFSNVRTALSSKKESSAQDSHGRTWRHNQNLSAKSKYQHIDDGDIPLRGVTPTSSGQTGIDPLAAQGTAVAHAPPPGRIVQTTDIVVNGAPRQEGRVAGSQPPRFPSWEQP